MTSFILTLAFICNLRAHMMRPVTENEINSDQDILKRGSNLWVGRIPFGSETDSFENSDPFTLNEMSESMQTYVKKHKTEYLIDFSGLSENIWEDVLENGAVFVSYKVEHSMMDMPIFLLHIIVFIIL